MLPHARGLVAAIGALLAAGLQPGAVRAQAPGTSTPPAAASPALPSWRVDPAWPKTLPDNWGIGQAAGIAVDGRDHVWVIHRPGSMTEDERGAVLTPPRSECCVPAPSVMEFDGEGNLVRAWGGPGHHPDWPAREHGIYVDRRGDVWLAGNAPTDHVVLKFSAEGRFLLRIGVPRETGGSNDTQRLGLPADMFVDEEAGELYVADGYGNRRVIVFDATTGAYKRHWGAYGERPNDDPQPPYVANQAPSRSFGNPVHSVLIATDGLLYVADRRNDRVQVFRKDGGFVREFFIARATLGPGSTWDLDMVPGSSPPLFVVADGSNNVVWLVSGTGEIRGRFGRNGRMAGEFHWVHNIATDSRGNVYTSEVDTGKRVQRFTPTAPPAR